MKRLLPLLGLVELWLMALDTQIGYGSNRKTRHLMPSGHKAFLVHNIRDMDMLLMHNRTFAAELVIPL